ncbi:MULTISPECIES: hypothetical protein [unclassified Pseudomonas]|uniref:hypothetical protein n=1 Tax=unclassified Pseudomonas TaxID=196821 RepID=UPI001C4579EA|nr:MULTISPECIES: hypothetical protein [unclassified Pseudomonas]
MHDLIIALLRDQNIHTGYWGLTVHFSATGTSVAQEGRPKTALPGLAVAVTGVTLVPAKDGEEGSLDASLVNPAKTTRTRSSAKAKALH